MDIAKYSSHIERTTWFIYIFSVPSHLTVSIWNILLFHKQGDYNTPIQYKWVGRTEWVCLKSLQASVSTILWLTAGKRSLIWQESQEKVKAKIKSHLFIVELISLKNTRKSSKVILVTLPIFCSMWIICLSFWDLFSIFWN